MAGRGNPYKNVNLNELNELNNNNMKNIFPPSQAVKNVRAGPPSQAVKNVRAGLPYMGVSHNAHAEAQRQAREAERQAQILQELRNLPPPPTGMSNREFLNALRRTRPPQLTLDQKVTIFFNQLCAYLRTRNMSTITTIQKFKEAINPILISARFQKEEKSRFGITKIDRNTFERIRTIINTGDPTVHVPCLLEVYMPKPPTGAGTGGHKKKRKRKTPKRKTTKRKTPKRKTTKRKTTKRKTTKRKQLNASLKQE